MCVLHSIPDCRLFTSYRQIKYVEDTVNCSFENVSYRETLKGGVEQSIQLAVVNKRVVLKSTNEVWVPPEKGFVKFMFQEVVAKPTVADALEDKYLGKCVCLAYCGVLLLSLYYDWV